MDHFERVPPPLPVGTPTPAQGWRLWNIVVTVFVALVMLASILAAKMMLSALGAKTGPAHNLKERARLAEEPRSSGLSKRPEAASTTRQVESEKWRTQSFGRLELTSPVELLPSESPTGAEVIRGEGLEYSVTASRGRMPAGMSVENIAEGSITSFATRMNDEIASLKTRPMTFLGRIGVQTVAEIDVNGSIGLVEVRAVEIDGEVYLVTTMVEKGKAEPAAIVERIFALAKLKGDKEAATGAKDTAPGDWRTVVADNLQLDCPFPLKTTGPIEDIGGRATISGRGGSTKLVGFVALRSFWRRTAADTAEGLVRGEVREVNGELLSQKTTEIKFLGLPGVQVGAEIKTATGLLYVTVRLAEAEDVFYSVMLTTEEAPGDFAKTRDRIFGSARLLQPSADWPTYEAGRIRIKSPVVLKRGRDEPKAQLLMGREGQMTVVCLQEKLEEHELKLTDVLEKNLDGLTEGLKLELEPPKRSVVTFLRRTGVEYAAEGEMRNARVKLVMRGFSDSETAYLICVIVPLEKSQMEMAEEIFSSAYLEKK